MYAGKSCVSHKVRIISIGNSFAILNVVHGNIDYQPGQTQILHFFIYNVEYLCLVPGLLGKYSLILRSCKEALDSYHLQGCSI